MNHKKLLLTLTLCLCALLCMVVTASASEVQGHSHPVCGKTHTDIGDHTGTCGNVTWTAWNGTSEIAYDSTTKTAYIYLADNVNISNKLTIPQGHTLYLCLNGHSITKTSEDGTFGGAIVVEEGGKLVLCDCKPSGNEGSITHSPGIEGRGVRMGGSTHGVDTEFLMYGGKISGNHVGDDGAGVQIQNATFKMYGGEISDNHVERAGYYGGGGVNVYNGGTFTMYGGKISGNTINGNDGGGVAAFNADFKMYGGTITGNAAGNMGGGVYVGNTSPILSGGSITGNTCGANANGGGVGTYNCDAILFSGNVQITGNVKGGTITNGTLSGGVANNFYLPSGTYITITDELTGSARIGVTTENTPGVGGVKYVTIVSSGSKESLQKLVTNGVLSYENKNEDGSPIGLFTKSNGYSTSLRACSHDFSQWAYSDTQHWKKCANCDAEDAVNKTDHSGGTATCTAPAVCTTCGQPYGNSNPNNHALVHHEAQAPTCTAVGWEAYDTCSRCDYSTTKVEIPMAAHTYGTPTYVWAANNASCTATRTCTACQHVEDETVNTQQTVTQNRSCTLNELSTFTATFTNTAFAQQIKENVTTADMTGHTYGAVSYTWATDKTTCKAEHKCTACQHVENETVNTQKQVTQNRSCTRNELSTFTATFTNTAFAQQIKENVTTADMTGHTYGAVSYTWATDKTTCKAEHKCTACQHVENETVNTQKQVTQNRSCTRNELSTFTATFTNTAFVRQTEENVKTADMAPHTYGGTWVKGQDGHWKVCEVCQNQSEVKPHTWKDATYTAPKTCTVCGATQGEPLTRSYYYYAPSVAENKKDSPKTADPGVLLYAGLALASLTGLACTAKKRH